MFSKTFWAYSLKLKIDFIHVTLNWISQLHWFILITLYFVDQRHTIGLFISNNELIKIHLRATTNFACTMVDFPLNDDHSLTKHDVLTYANKAEVSFTTIFLKFMSQSTFLFHKIQLFQFSEMIYTYWPESEV